MSWACLRASSQQEGLIACKPSYLSIHPSIDLSIYLQIHTLCIMHNILSVISYLLPIIYEYANYYILHNMHITLLCYILATTDSTFSLCISHHSKLCCVDYAAL